MTSPGIGLAWTWNAAMIIVSDLSRGGLHLSRYIALCAIRRVGREDLDPVRFWWVT
jgi:hypothetical protein